MSLVNMDRIKHQEYISRSLKYLEDNLASPIQVGDVCAQVPLSTWQVQRIFRFLLGTSIGTYLRTRRLTEAYLRIVQGSETKIANLAFEFQFTSHEAFTRAFKSYFGFLPSEATNNGELFRLKKNMGLDESQLDLIWSSIKDISRIRLVDSFQLSGLAQQTNSPFSNGGEFENNTMLLWNTFFTQTKGLQKTEHYSTKAYGVALNSDVQLISDQMNYLVSKKRIEYESWPEKFIRFEIPSHEYAQFTMTGNLHQIERLVDYVYGIWLPGSGYQRAPLYDWEGFDFKGLSQSGQFEYQYNIPIVKKGSN